MVELDTFPVKVASSSQTPVVYSSHNIGDSQNSAAEVSSSSWTSQKDNGFRDGFPSISGYNHDQQMQQVEFTLSKDVHITMNASSLPSASSTHSAPHKYTGYASHPTCSPDLCNATAYQIHPNYHSDHQHQVSSYSYPQFAGAHETSGAPNQTYTPSFQSPGSYVGPSSYSGTYYNAGDYQTTGGGYDNNGYTGQTSMWHDGSYGNYSQHYSSYTASDSNGTHSHGSGAVAETGVHYQQHYKQWVEFYRQSTDVTCAPGTENISVNTSTAASVECPIPGMGGQHLISAGQLLPTVTASWKLDSSLSGSPLVQTTVTSSDHLDSSWQDMSSGFPSKHLNQQPYFMKPPGPGPALFGSRDGPQNTAFSGPSGGFTMRYPTMNRGPSPLQTYQTHLQPSIPAPDVRRAGKVHIPTNPRIASPSILGVSKIDKDSSAAISTSKPAYISVSIPKVNSKVSSTSACADTVFKAGMFPASLRAYVERALARCKDDPQKASCQTIMKEIITKASADGTLFTRNWDVEPLFPMPTTDSMDKDFVHAFLPKFNRSPSRRTKSRWEPLPEEKLGDKVSPDNYDPIRDVTWDCSSQREKMVDNGKIENKGECGSQREFISLQQPNFQYRNIQSLVKKPRLESSSGVALENGEASGDSDKEEGLTAYYAAAANLANSPEERKKRENRFKRFDEGNKLKPFRPRSMVAGGGSLYAKRTTAFFNKNYEEAVNRAVEDMDWDSLTLRGTCQEIEKRYLRLTSAPDPSSVRPEEVLEKALIMVRNSQRNYLYKCDQLKSIRQDLTVQRIRNWLTVQVYETHARLALEVGDLPEYNQCQSQLKSLYTEGIVGCHMEFSAYNLLCVILHSNNNRDLLSSMARLSTDAKKDVAVNHALAVRAAVSSGNYVSFFRLYKSAPNLNTCLMDLHVEKMRFEAVKCMSRSYRPSVPVAFIARILGFSIAPTAESNNEKDVGGLEECEEWLRAHGASLIVDNNGDFLIDTKMTSSCLYMPDDAVAHGDASLAVNDFLTRAS